MQECLQRFARRKPSQKWTSQEKEQLKQTVIKIEPKENEGWREVCLKMHELGSRRTQQEYKNRGIIYLQNNETQQIKFNNQQLDHICRQFQRGLSVKCLTKKFAHLLINPVRLRSRLIQRFESIRCSIRRIVGVSKTRPIKIQDYELFQFIRNNHYQLLTLEEVAQLSRRHKVIKKPKTDEQRKQIEIIEKKLSHFNNSLYQYSKVFQEFKKTQQTNNNQQKDKIHIGRSATVPFRHLAQVTMEFNELQRSQITSESGDNSFLNEAEQNKLGQVMNTTHSFGEDKEWQPKVGTNYFDFAFCSIDFQCDDQQLSQDCHDSFFRRQTAV